MRSFSIILLATYAVAQNIGNSGSCSYWCRTPQGEAYCCEWDNEVATQPTGTQSKCSDVHTRFRCDDGQNEIACRYTCDNHSDCNDHSDEEGCVNYILPGTSPGGRQGRSEESADDIIIGVVIVGLILILTIIAVAAYIYRRAQLLKLSQNNSEQDALPLDNQRYEYRRPSELSHIGPAVSHYDVPRSNKPVPGARADSHYDRVPRPSPVPGARGDTHYDRLRSPVPVLGARGDSHYDRLPKPMPYTDNIQEGNYDFPNSPVSISKIQQNYSFPRAPESINEFENLYDSPKSPVEIHPEATYDFPQKPSQGVYNPTYNTTGCMLYDSPRSPVATTHVPTIHEEDQQIYDTPCASPRPIAIPMSLHTDGSDYQEGSQIYDTPVTLPRPIIIPRTTNTSVSDDYQVLHSENEGPMYANQNDIFNEK